MGIFSVFLQGVPDRVGRFSAEEVTKMNIDGFWLEFALERESEDSLWFVQKSIVCRVPQ